MAKSSTNLHLATTQNEHETLYRQGEKLVDLITKEGEGQSANHLFALIELLTDSRTHVDDRERLSFKVLQRAFMYTDAARLALEQEICRVNPRLKVPSYISSAVVRKVSNG